MLHKAIIGLLLLAGAASGQTREKRKFSRTWLWSAAAVVAGNVLDAHSSGGRYEANPMLRGGDGLYSAGRGAAFKLGLSGGFLAVQALVIRRGGTEYEKPFAVGNFGMAGALAGIAARNYGVPRAAR